MMLEPVYAVIDYCDANNNKTRRRITLLTLKRGTHGALLLANCHERRAMRTFRCDRIAGFIDNDGVVTEPANFFRNVMGIDLDEWDLAAPIRETNFVAFYPTDQARRIRDRLRPMISVLLAGGRSDGALHPEEIDAMQRYIERETSDWETRFGERVSIAALDELNRMLPKIRPQQSSIPRYFAACLDLNPARAARFDRALEEVIMADGAHLRGEVEFMEELASLRNQEHRRIWGEAD